MPVNLPAHVVAERFLQYVGAQGLGQRHVMLKAVPGNIVHKSVQVGHAANRHAAEGRQRIVRKFALSQIAPDDPVLVIRRHLEEGHSARAHASLERAEAYLAPQCSGENVQLANLRLFAEGACRVI
jgi:hypothetical protein